MSTVENSPETTTDLSQVTNEDFVDAVMRKLADGAHPAICIKSGNPEKGGWKAENYDDYFADIMPSDNNYLNCSGYYPQEDGEIRVKDEHFGCYNFVICDDVGTKVQLSKFDDIDYSWKIGTSPDNYQLGIILTEPITDLTTAKQLNKAFVNAGYSDKGAGGVGRWARLPQAINGKEKYQVDGQPFRCRFVEWHPEVHYTVEQLVATLGLTLEEPKQRKKTAPSDDGSASISDDEVITKLKKAGSYKNEISQGKHDITCPWVTEHTDSVDDGAAYFEPTADYPAGGFKCHHSHGDNLNIHDLRVHLGLDKPTIKVIPGNMEETVMKASRILAADPNIYFFGNMLGRIKNDERDDVTFSPFNNAELTLLLAQKIQWLKPKDDDFAPCDPPERYVRILYDGGTTSGVIPELKGIARQPYFREGDWRLVTKAGYNPVSKLYGAFDSEEFQPRKETREKPENSLKMLRELLSEFKFVDKKDEAVTLAAIFTAVARTSIGLAPGFHVHASTIGSGKSYLCKLIALFASAAPTEKVAYPKNDEDATKKMLSLLLKSPACVEFDDMSGNWKPFTILKQMFTSEAVTDRLLGINKTATVSTRVLILGSGNNVVPDRDMLRRVFTIYIDPQVETPTGLSYKGDPVLTVKKNRGKYVMAVINIIEAWMAAGRPESEVLDIASYNGDWTKYCRQPLAWLGVADPIVSLIEQVAHDPDRDSLGALLQVWNDCFGETPTTVRKVLDSLKTSFGGCIADDMRDLDEVLQELPVVDKGFINNRKFGWFLSKNENRIVGSLKFVKDRADGRVAWKVVKVDSGNS